MRLPGTGLRKTEHCAIQIALSDTPFRHFSPDGGAHVALMKAPKQSFGLAMAIKNSSLAGASDVYEIGQLQDGKLREKLTFKIAVTGVSFALTLSRRQPFALQTHDKCRDRR